MKKKVLSVLLSTAMVASMLIGCGGKEEAPATDAPAEEGEAEAPAGDLHFEIVSKGFQHQYWVAVYQGAQEKADELGVTINFVGPNTESDIADQVQMLNNAINAAPAAIGFAALDTEAALDSIQSAMDAGIPMVGFDSGVPGAPEGAILANCATDNYAAGEVAAEEAYKVIAEKIAAATAPVRIGLMAQDATGESVIMRGLGFIDKMGELLAADGKTLSLEGNDKYVGDATAETVEGGDVIIDIAVPADMEMAKAVTDVQNMLNKEDTICIYGSNQHTGEAMAEANLTLNRFGQEDGDVIGLAFDSGANIKGAVADGTFIGAVTQAPVAMGAALVDSLYKAVNGEEIADVDTGCQWYTADNMEDPEIAPNLYD